MSMPGPTSRDITGEGSREATAREAIEAIKGRGTAENPKNRFAARHTEPTDDGWGGGQAIVDRGAAPPTRLFPDRTVNLIARNQSPDIPFDRSINPYKGCEHGCIYCFARPTHAYLDLSPGLDFETKIFYKTRVRERLAEALSKPSYQCQTIAMGTNTDPYQPAEKRHRITREVLQVLLETRHPVSLVTKSRLILRDLDLLTQLAELGLVSVAVSVTTLSNSLKTKLEPRTAGPQARLRTIAALAEAGVPVSAMVAPVIPFINDQEIEHIVAAVSDAGAASAGYILLRLPGEVRDLFHAWLRQHYPLKADRVINAVRGTRGGQDYQAKWGVRMRGEGQVAELIAARFKQALKQAGLVAKTDVRLRTDLFRPPGQQQLNLL